MRRLMALGAVCAILVPGAVSAQFSPGARSVGMGGAGMVYASGVDAIEWNPANLALEGGWNATFEAGGSGLISGVTCDDLGAILGFGQCDTAPWGWNFDPVGCDASITAGLPESGVRLSTNTEGYLTALGAESADLPKPGSPLPTLGVAIGSMGLRVRSHVMTETTVSKELMQLMCEGFDPALIQEYKVGDTGFRTTSFSEITAGYGTTVGRMAVGIGVRYVIGHSLTQGRFFEPELDLTNETIDVNAVAVESTGGSGYGIDIGLALDLIAGLRVSASASNIIQKMSWDEELIAHEATYRGCTNGTAACPGGDDFEELDFEDFINRFEGEPISSGSSVSLPVYQTAQELFRAAYFPTVLRAGAGWRAGGTSVELVGTSVSPRGRQRNEWDQRISLGVEQWLWVLALRAGGALGSDGLQAINGGIGIGIGPVEIDFSGGIMSGGFDFASGIVAPENVEYAGAQATVSIQLKGGGR